MPALPRSVDDLLDKTVVLSFTNLGYWLRRGGFDDLPRLEGESVIVTGATSGLGKATAEGLIGLGARVWVVGRNEEKAERVSAELAAAGGDGEAVVGICDVSDLDSVRRLADEVLARGEPVRALIHNAGALLADRQESPQGIETTFATHVVGPFLLTSLLRSALAAAASPRVIAVSSGGMYTRRIEVRDLQSTEDYDGTVAYARAKRAQVILSAMGARALAADGIVVHSMHPGWADTPGVQKSLPTFRKVTRPFLRNAAQGADTIVWLAAASEPAMTTGRFWLDREARPVHRLDRTRETPDEREGLWTAVAELAGVDGCPPPPEA